MHTRTQHRREMGDVRAHGAIYTNTLLHLYLANYLACCAALGLQPRCRGHSASTRATCPKFLAWCAAQLRCTTACGHAELAGHAPLHPEKERVLCVAPVQERGPTQHSTRESHRRTEISAARGNRNVVDTNVRIVSPHGRRAGCAGAHEVQRRHPAHTPASVRPSNTMHRHCLCMVFEGLTLALSVHGVRRPYTNTCTRNSSSKYGGIPGQATAPAASSDAAATEISNVKFVLPTPEARVWHFAN